MRLDPKASLQDLVFNAEGPGDILDAFCFVVGYTTGEIKRRQAALFEAFGTDAEALVPDTFKQYAEADAQIRAAWLAFRPDEATEEPKKAGRIASGTP